MRVPTGRRRRGLPGGRARRAPGGARPGGGRLQCLGPGRGGVARGGAGRGLVQFPRGAIPAGSQIDSADLNLYWDDSFASSTSSTQPAQTVQAYQSTTAWNPATVTWNSNIGLGTEGVNQVVVTSTSAGTSAKGAWPSQPSTAAANGSSYRYAQDTTAGGTFSVAPQRTQPG